MKRILFLILALSMVLTCFTSCGASLPSEPAVTEETVESGFIYTVKGLFLIPPALPQALHEW